MSAFELEARVLRQLCLHFHADQRDRVWEVLRQYAEGHRERPPTGPDAELPLADTGLHPHLVARLQNADVAWTLADLERLGWKATKPFIKYNTARWRRRLSALLIRHGLDGKGWEKK